eukprot:m.11155 g.11155  ORF g.11155 m.11155 type:complete len:191 (+) comp5678_c0_seq1:697-1269(+)
MAEDFQLAAKSRGKHRHKLERQAKHSSSRLKALEAARNGHRQFDRHSQKGSKSPKDTYRRGHNVQRMRKKAETELLAMRIQAESDVADRPSSLRTFPTTLSSPSAATVTVPQSAPIEWSYESEASTPQTATSGVSSDQDSGDDEADMMADLCISEPPTRDKDLESSLQIDEQYDEQYDELDFQFEEEITQ